MQAFNGSGRGSHFLLKPATTQSKLTKFRTHSGEQMSQWFQNSPVVYTHAGGTWKSANRIILPSLAEQRRRINFVHTKLWVRVAHSDENWAGIKKVSVFRCSGWVKKLEAMNSGNFRWSENLTSGPVWAWEGECRRNDWTLTPILNKYPACTATQTNQYSAKKKYSGSRLLLYSHLFLQPRISLDFIEIRVKQSD